MKRRNLCHRKMGDAPNDFIVEQLEKIVAIEIEIDSIVGKFLK